MVSSQPAAPRPLPSFVKAVGSVFVLGHLLSVALLALGATNGPWPTKWGTIEGDGPAFAQRTTNQISMPYYLWPLRMTHNYHFLSNRVSDPAVFFEVELKNDMGEVKKKLKFPDEKANFWVRQRQAVLAQALGMDQPVQTRGTEVIPAPRKTLPTVEYWEMAEAGVMRLKVVPEHLAPRDRAFRPSETSKILAQSYMRYLCRQHGAQSAELIRHSREAIVPMVLFMPDGVPPDTFTILKSNFGEYRREK